jgi:RNA polymerase sigma-70 factor (ECF subfamily)
VLADEDELKSLMMQSLAGDAGATRDLLTRLAEHLRAYFGRRVHYDAVEDLVQETLLAMYLKRETFDPAALLSVWVYAIARHKLIDSYRRRHSKVMIPLESAETLPSQEDTEHAAIGADLERLLAELPEKQATAIRCMRIEGLSAFETAAQTGQSVAAVKVAVHRGLRKLAARLNGRQA